MLRPSFGRGARITAAVLGAVAAIGLGFAWRLSTGPIRADWLKPGLERALAAQVKGGSARLDHVGLVWFSEARSLGLELDGVRVDDAKGRDVVRARRVEAAVALDATPGFRFAPGRMTAQDFFVAVSVSPQGSYELGYEASGTPKGQSGLDQLFGDLTGEARLGRPASFLRQVDLSNGRLALRQVGGVVDWVADVRDLRFQKTRNKLTADADLRVRDGGGGAPATLQARAVASVGLTDAYVQAVVDNLVPARVFPSVGSTRPLSALDAVVRGRGSLSYDFKSGMRSADVAFEAGKGTLRFGSARQAFESATAVADYDPATGEVALQTLKVAAEKTRLDLTGRFRLIPDDPHRQRPAQLEFAVRGPHLFASFSPDSPPQELSDVVASGRLTPEARRLDISEGRALIGGVPIKTSGVLFQDARNRWGARLTAEILGSVGREQVFAFWPKNFVASSRAWLHQSVLSGRFTNARFELNAPAGEFERDALHDQALKLSFDFDQAGFRFYDKLAPITDGQGRAVLGGNSFNLALARGRIEAVELSEGVVSIPAFNPKGAIAEFRMRAVGDAHDVLQVLDHEPLRLISGSGFKPERASGRADVHVDIRRPMLFDVQFDDYRFHYEGVIREASVRDAALGWDLQHGDLKLDGDDHRFTLTGAGEAGPYRGALRYVCNFHGGGEHGQTLDLDGLIRASAFGGREGATVPFGGKFHMESGAGAGVVHSPAFDGRVGWKDGDGPQRFTLEGWGDGRALRKAGFPFVDGLPDRFPTQLELARAGDVWKGPLHADALSGAVSFTGGQRSRLIYEADLTPIKARRLGLGDLPLFDQARHVAVDAAWAGEQGAAQVRAGSLDFALSWTRDPAGAVEHKVRADLTAADFAALGLPPIASRGGVPVSATWRAYGEGLAGAGMVADTPVRFQTAPGRGGSVYTVSADLDRAALKRWGAPDMLQFDGVASVNARLTSADHGALSGRVDVDLGRADLSVARSDWRKPAGRPARASFDFNRDADGEVKLTRLSADGDNLELEGGATLSNGRLVAIDLAKARLNGLVDAAVRLTREPNSGAMNVVLRGRQLDARRLLDHLGDAPGSNQGGSDGGRGDAADAVRLDASLDSVRLTDAAVLRDVRASGVWGSPAQSKLDWSATTGGGGKLRGRVFPLAGVTAVAAETTDAGDAMRSLFGIQTLRGGKGTLTGRLVDGGADLNLEVANVRLVRAPTMAQILTMASLTGLADTLNGEGVMFTRVVAPVQIRGKRLIVAEARATGAAIGLTTKGVADFGADTLDFHGTIAPAYTLNSAVGAVPVLGQLLTSRKGEGVVGLGYAARGSFEKPQVMVNPLSLVTPGILRRMFEGAPPSADAPAPAPAKAKIISTRSGDT